MGQQSATFLPMLKTRNIGFRSHEDIWNMRSDRMNLPEDARDLSSRLHFGALRIGMSIEEMLEIGIEKIWEHDLPADMIVELANRRVGGHLSDG